MGNGTSCAAVDIVTDDEVKAAIKSITDWEETQKAGQRASQALRTVRKDSFRKAANELNSAGSIVDRLGGPDRVHDIIQAFYRKLFAHQDVRHFFENLPSDRMRAKQMKFMRYLVGGPKTYGKNLRCRHFQMVSEQGLDVAKFQVLVDLLQDTFHELAVPQDVIDDILVNVEHAKAAIFTPNADELVKAEEMVAAAAELQNSLITRLGGPQAVQLIVQAFYKKLFSSEQLKYFFVSMSAERLRNMQFKFMRYLFCGAASYALTGGNMRCIHARMVKENGLDLDKFNMVVQMLQDVLNDLMVAKKNVREIMANVESAREAIFTPGPDELVTKEEMMAEAVNLDVDIVDRMGGPAVVYDMISRFYAKLFNDQKLKYFFMLSTAKLRNKQFRFMRYLLGGPASYAAIGGNLRCKHMPLIRDKGLDTEMFDHAVDMLKGVVADMGGLPPDVMAEIVANVEHAKATIFTPGPEELINKAELIAAAEALNSELVMKIGGAARVYNVLSLFYVKIFNDPHLKYIFSSLSEQKLRGKQFKLMAYLFGGPSAYALASPGNNLRCVHARLIRENGLDMAKFDRVVRMMVETLKEEDASEEVIAGIAQNVEFAREAIFTPGADELVTKEELMEEAAALPGDLVAQLGGPEMVYTLIARFYARLFNDHDLRFFFTLSAERLRSKQFKFMRYLIGGPSTYSGDLTRVHANMVANRGLDNCKFDRAVDHLATALRELGDSVPASAVEEIMRHVETARQAILGSSCPVPAAAAAAAPPQSLYERVGGDAGVGSLVDAVHARVQAQPSLEKIYNGVDMEVQRRRQLGFLRALWGAPDGAAAGADAGGGSRPASGSAGGGMTLGLAHAHLARDKGLYPEDFEALRGIWLECLTAQEAPEDAVSQVRDSLGPGNSLLYPPGPAKPSCPFAAVLTDEEAALDAILASAAAAAAAQDAAAPAVAATAGSIQASPRSPVAATPRSPAAPTPRSPATATPRLEAAAARTPRSPATATPRSEAAAAAATPRSAATVTPRSEAAAGAAAAGKDIISPTVSDGLRGPVSSEVSGPTASDSTWRVPSAAERMLNRTVTANRADTQGLGAGVLGAEEEALLDKIEAPPPPPPRPGTAAAATEVLI